MSAETPGPAAFPQRHAQSGPWHPPRPGQLCLVMPAAFARYRVEPEERISLADHDPGDTDDYGSSEEAKPELAALTDRIAGLQECLFAEDARSLLVVLQGIDAARLQPGRRPVQRAAPFDYKVSLGPVGGGHHEVTARFGPAKSPPGRQAPRSSR